MALQGEIRPLDSKRSTITVILAGKGDSRRHSGTCLAKMS